MKKQVLAVVAAIAATLFAQGATGASAPATTKADQVKAMAFALSSPQSVQACDEVKAGGERKCVDVRMPAKVGEVNRIVVGDFLRPVRGAWLALGDKKSSLCALPAGQRDSMCIVLDNAPLTNINVTFEQRKGIGMLFFAPIDGREEKLATDAKIAKFDAALTKAVSNMQTHITARRTGKSLVKVAGGIPSAHECGIKEDVVYVCPPDDEDPPFEPNPDSPEQQPSEPGGPNETGEKAGPGQKCIPGPVTVCITAPPPPLDEPPPLQPSPPWTFCSLLGWFCDGPPTLPPPLPPLNRTLEEELAECDVQYNNQLDECIAYRKAYGDRAFFACKERVELFYSQCLADARARHKQ